MFSSAILLSAVLFFSSSNAAPTPATLLGFPLSLLAAKPTLPDSTLPAPADGTTLQYIGLGLGTQNYTCATGDAFSVPVATGAKANLFDATQRMSVPVVSRLTMSSTTCNADKTNSALAMTPLGLHYFDASGIPTFDLSMGSKTLEHPDGMFLSSKKIAADPASSSACTGRNGASAVAWLMLDQRDNGLSRGISRVYRVETTGGSAPATCEGMAPGEFTVDYSALYWFYG